MIPAGLKYQGKTPLDYQCTLIKNEGQEGKISLFWGGVIIVGDAWAQGKGEWGWIWRMYFLPIYENRRMKSVEIVLRNGRDERTIEGVNLTKIYCKHISNISVYPPVNYYMLIKLNKILVFIRYHFCNTF
jgi:hypothetical protein